MGVVVFDRFLMIALMLVVALAPLPLGSNRPVSWSLVAFVIGGLSLLWGLAAIYRPTLLRLPNRAAIIPAVGWALLVLWHFFQSSGPSALWHPFWNLTGTGLGIEVDGAISISPFDTGTAAMRLMVYGLVFWLAAQTGRDSQNARVMTYGVCGIVLFYSLYGLMNELLDADTILWFEKWAYHDALTSTFVNRNSFASFAVIGMITTMGLAFRALRREQPRPQVVTVRRRDMSRVVAGLLIGITVLIGIALMLTRSRAGLIAGGIGIAALVMGHFLRDRRMPPWPVLVGGVIIGSVVLLIAAGTGTFERKVDDPEAGDLGGRGWLAQRTLSAIADRPLTGHGGGAFESYFQRYKNADFGGVYAISKAHNSYLEFAADVGIPATILMLAVFGWILLSCIRGLHIRKQDTSYPAIAIAVIIAAGLHALVDFSLQIPAIAILFAFVLGIGYAQSFPTGGGRHNRL